jgi:hypothetical protein
LVHEWRKEYSEIIEDAGFSGSLPAITSTDAAVLFLAQNLRLIADGGNVGIIVPDSLVCAEKYLRFRASLLESIKPCTLSAYHADRSRELMHWHTYLFSASAFRRPNLFTCHAYRPKVA